MLSGLRNLSGWASKYFFTSSLEEAKIDASIDFLLQHGLLHHLSAHRATNVFGIEATLSHCFIELFDRSDALLARNLQHAAVHFGLDVVGQIEFLALLQQQLFVDQRGDQFGLASS